MTIVNRVKLIVAAACKSLPGAEVIAPLAVWDNNAGGMGVQIRVPQMRGGTQKCLLTASFVLSKADLTLESRIKFKAVTAVNAIRADVQIKVVPVEKPQRLVSAQAGLAEQLRGTG